MRFILLVIISFFVYAEEIISVKSKLPETDHVIILDFKSVIHHGLANFLDKVLANTNKGTKALILELNTPGGDLEATNRIISRFFETDFPVIIHVTPNTGSATSAGVFLVTGAHLSYMTPGSSIGSAHPVSGNGQDIPGDMRKKVENYAVTNIVSLAKQRSRNQDWVKKAVIESASLNAEDALKKNVINGSANNLNELFSKIKNQKIKIKDKEVLLPDFNNYQKIIVQPDHLDRLISFLANPTTISLLSMIAILGITIEFYHPGLILPGLTGAICLLLTFLTMNMISVNTSGIIFLVIGSALLVAEVFVTSGLLGAVGIICMSFGFFFLFDIDILWGIGPNFYLIYIVLGLLAMLFLWTIKEILLAKRISGKDFIIGRTGIVTHKIAFEGKVELDGVYWLANSEKEIESGKHVKVVSRDGLRLKVEEV